MGLNVKASTRRLVKFIFCERCQPPSLRGGTTKQSRSIAFYMDCFVPRNDAKRERGRSPEACYDCMRVCEPHTLSCGVNRRSCLRHGAYRRHATAIGDAVWGKRRNWKTFPTPKASMNGPCSLKMLSSGTIPMKTII